MIDGAFGELSADQAIAVRRVETNSTRLLSLIDDLLTLSRVEEHGLRGQRRDLDLRQVVRTAYDVVSPAWSNRNLAVRLTVPDAPVPFTGDRDMMERVVVNLLGNAVKFTPDGGQVRVSLVGGEDWITIQVRDTGFGVPVEEQDKLFTRFFRSSAAQQQAIPGSGLGLSIAHAIVDMHAGSIAVESDAGKGTTFRVRLPVRR